MAKHKGIRRRDFSKGLAGASTLAIFGGTLAGCGGSPPIDSAVDVALQFTHGVASGDPLQDRVILWTRAVPEQAGPVSAVWEISENERFDTLVSSGIAHSDAGRDYTMKVDAHGMRPGSKYFYRFRAQETVSAIGETRTLPGADVSQVRLAVASCSNYPAGYFHAYREIANREFDAVLHLGDYIYEYGRGGYAMEDAERLGRQVLPEGELLLLDDYRQRYAQYRSDPDLQAAHAAHPFIVVWDDHELANDCWRGGAENHQRDEEGRWEDRRKAAVQAWHEWMPVRAQPGHDRIWRSFQFGNLVNLMMLDTRVRGRDLQLDAATFLEQDPPDFAGMMEAVNSPNRSLLDATQREWLYRGLESSSATWQVLGQQVLMMRLETPASAFKALRDGDTDKGLDILQRAAEARSKDRAQRSDAEQQILDTTLPINLDAWDGYGHERDSLLRRAVAKRSRLVSLAGDTHNGWASNLRTDSGEQAGIELACQSISSPGIEEYLKLTDAAAARRLEKNLTAAVPELSWCNLDQRGFMSVEFRREKLDAEWIFARDIKQQMPEAEPYPPHRLSVQASAVRIVDAGEQSATES